MKYYTGLDVSNIDTSICIVDYDGNVVKEAKVLSDPDSIHRYLKKTGLEFEKIGMEAGDFRKFKQKIGLLFHLEIQFFA